MSRALVILALALLASAALAVDVFPVRGEPATFPGNGANFPQDRGAPTKTGQFVDQAQLAGSPFPFTASHIAAGSPYADGLGGAFRGQIVGAGVDPVRGVFRTARNGWGHSGGSAPIYRGGRGGGSGDGYHTAQTRLPERGDVNGFITERSLPEQFDDASSLSASVVSMIVALVAAFALFF